MKPIVRILSSLMVVTMIASLLPCCSKSPATSTPGTSNSGASTPVSTVQVTPGPGTKMTPQLDNKDLVAALIPVNGGQIQYSFLTS